MIADRNRIYDGWVNLEAGVDAGRAPEMIEANQVHSATNMTFRGGDISTRPGFRKLTQVFPDLGDQIWCYGQAVDDHVVGEYAAPGIVDPGSIDPEFENQNSEFIYQNGILQTAHAYSPHYSEDCIMALVGGRFYKIVPSVNTATVTEVIPETDSPPAMRNYGGSPIAYMVQGDKWLFAQDGRSKPIIYDSVNCRRSKTYVDRTHTEVPVGTIMSYGMGRLCVVVNKRDVAFGDLYGSHDLPDPADSIPFFTERNFLTEGFDAAIPFNQGLATGMVFFPQLDTSTGNGQLLVFAERGASSFFLSLPREVWKTSQFQILALLTTGMRGHRSISAVNEDLWFRADDGMRSYRQARSESTGWAHIPLSTNVKQYMDYDTSWLLKYASAIYFDNRILVTVAPAWNQRRVFHGAMAAVDFDILSSFGVNAKPAWEGVWRFPNDIKIIQLVTGQFHGVTRAFAFCLDENSQNQIYEITRFDVNDWDDQCIQWEVVSRGMDFSRMSQESTPFNEVELYDADLWVKEVRRCSGTSGETPPIPPPTPTGACCIDGVCSIMTEEACTGQGGTYMGNNTPCEPNPCEEPPPPTCPLPFSHYTPVTIPADQVPSNQTDFVVTLKYLDPRFKHVDEGDEGHVQSPGGFDIRPYTSDDCSVALTYELERYDASIGEVVMHVKIPSLSSITDNELFLFYGNPSLITDDSSTDTWSNNFLAVYHLKDGDILNTESSTGSFDGTNNGATPTEGLIDGAANFVAASNQYIDLGSTMNPDGASITCLARAGSFPNPINAVVNRDGDAFFELNVRSNGKIFVAVGASGGTPGYDGTGVHTLLTDTWYHLAMTYADPDGLDVYVNSVLDGSDASDGGLQGDESSPWWIGGDSQVAFTRQWDGAIDEVRIHNGKRSGDWVAMESNNLMTPETFAVLGTEVENG